MRHVMRYLVLVAIVLLIVYEIWSIKSVQTGDTLSEMMWKLSERPLIPFMFGMLCGHYFWRK
jgi:hypothetical protein